MLHPSPRRPRPRPSDVRTPALLVALGATLLGARLDAQTLRGSRGSVDRAYSYAQSRRLVFHRSRAAVERAARRGTYVRLVNTATYRLRGVGIPYVLPTTRVLLGDLAARYRRQCGERLVVTSGMRLTVSRLVNSTPKSVHPAGLAFDLRAPRGRCRAWIRRELLSLERRGLIDATEERFPPHLHVVVYRSR